MPDDDIPWPHRRYQICPQTPACTCEHCSRINAKMEKDKQIKELLYKIDKQVGSRNANVTWNVLPLIIKILKIMNGVE
jgi:hypothetical protein